MIILNTHTMRIILVHSVVDMIYKGRGYLYGKAFFAGDDAWLRISNQYCKSKSMQSKGNKVMK